MLIVLYLVFFFFFTDEPVNPEHSKLCSGIFSSIIDDTWLIIWDPNQEFDIWLIPVELSCALGHEYYRMTETTPYIHIDRLSLCIDLIRSELIRKCACVLPPPPSLHSSYVLVRGEDYDMNCEGINIGEVDTPRHIERIGFSNFNLTWNVLCRDKR